MVTDQQEIKSLDAGLDCTIILLGLLMAAAWLFALFSYYLSRKTGTDWFSRSGAMMSLIGAVITFRQVNFYQSALATALKEGLVSVSEEMPQAAHILPGAFVPRLSNRNHRYRNLGLRGPTAYSRSLNAREKAPAVLGSEDRQAAKAAW